MKHSKNRLHSVLIAGATPAGVAAANKLGELGIPVTLVDSEADLDRKLGGDSFRLDSGIPFNYAHRPGLIRILRNPGIRCLLPAEIRSARHSQQGFSIRIAPQQTFVDPARCTLCGRCTEVCPVTRTDGSRPIQIAGRMSLPGRAVIDKRREPLCQANCPLGVNAQGYIALAAAGKYRQALDLIRADNVLPSICGRVCTHPCESACRRAELDDPLAIRDIKRFVADFAADSAETAPAAAAPQPRKVELRPEKVAVIGAGPAGLAAASDFARQGLQVTIFEKEHAAGGLLRFGIGPHRLPRHILDRELKQIREEGVQIVTGRVISIQRDLAELRETYAAVLLTTGSWADRRLGVPGEDLQGVEGCLAFLTRLYRRQVQPLSEKVAVIGDGNAAFDLARALQRLGAAVTMVSWFDRAAIPADPHEVKAALEEGIGINDNRQVVAFFGADGRMQGLRLKPTRPGSRPDANGIAWPEIVPDSQSFDMPFDRAFVAIGQCGAYSPTHNSDGLAVSERGYIAADADGRTGMVGVYAAGDAVSGASSVVQAMAGGRRAAASVVADLDLRAGRSSVQHMPSKPVRPLDRDFIPLDAHAAAAGKTRTPMPEIPPAQRRDNFDEVALGYTRQQVQTEAARCMQCGSCAQCLECLEACGANQALRHDEQPVEITENAGVLIIADPDMAPGIKGEDVIRAYGPPGSKTDVYAMMLRGFAAAAKAMVLLRKTSARLKGHGIAFVPPDPGLSPAIRIGVFACRCNNSLGWSPRMSTYLQSLRNRPEIVTAEELPSACIAEGIDRILGSVREKGITRVVLASCVCCPLNYVCSACTDQRSRLKDGLFSGTGISRSMVQTCNLRGEVLRLADRRPDLALQLFTGLIERSIGRAARLLPFPAPARTYNFTTAVIGRTEASDISALTLADTGMDVLMFGTQKNPLKDGPEHANIHLFRDSTVTGISGTLGNFQVHVRCGDATRSFSVGCVILGEKSRNIALYTQNRGPAGNTVQSTMQKSGSLGIPYMYPGTTSISGLFLADPPGVQISKHTKGTAAAALAAAAMPRGPRQNRGFSVVIKENVCRGCGRCLQVCPYQAVSLQPRERSGFTAFVDEVLCKGCGNCISVCPSNAADSPFRDQIYLEQTLEELLVGSRSGGPVQLAEGYDMPSRAGTWPEMN